METEDFQEIVGFRDKIWLMWKKTATFASHKRTAFFTLITILSRYEQHNIL